MDRLLIERVADEMRPLLTGTRFGRAFQTSRFEYYFDLRLPSGNYLFVSIEPAAPRVYLARRRLKDLERAALPPTPFVLQLRSNLANAEFTDIAVVEGERVMKLSFASLDEAGRAVDAGLVIQLTGRSANLFLTDSEDRIVATARSNEGTGQQIDDVFAPPPRPADFKEAPPPALPAISAGETLSEWLDREHLAEAQRREFQTLARNARGQLRSDISKRKKLLANLESDLRGHGDPDRWKRYGDLLLAAAGTAENRDGIIKV